ncbi:uncharacterized protein [Haliotis cracherodii]|uniref:uncharacterized protein n=1 Tax=Haliotis cracherodii TaxID=6455 RepID=UPI0039ED4EFF
MATKAARKYAQFTGCLSRCKSKDSAKSLQYPCEHFSTIRKTNQELSLPVRRLRKMCRSIHSTSTFGSPNLPKNRRNILNSYLYLNLRKWYYSTHPQRPKSRTHYYNILKVTPNATQSQIKVAYYELSKINHPDVNKNPEASLIFAEISEAYEVLGNVKNRRMYDRGVMSPLVQKGDDSFHDDEGFVSKRREAPTGRTNVYNFDEFYRQHYGNVRRKKQEDKQLNEFIRKEREEHHLMMMRNTAILFLILFSVAGYLAVEVFDLRQISVSPKDRKKD